MKKLATYAAALLLTTGLSTSFAQNNTQQDLNNAIQTAENIPQDVQTASNAIDRLVYELNITGTPDADAFYSDLFVLINQVQNNADDIDYFMGLAQNESPVSFSTAPVNQITAQLVALNDDVINLTTQIKDAVLGNQYSNANALIPALRNTLATQANLADNIISEIETIKQTATIYTVEIRLVDSEGHVTHTNDLHGYYAHNQATGEYLYPQDERDYSSGTFFLPSGTYTFDSFNGYWSGTGSNTVTLSNALVNEDGVIVVDLVLWSE
ncbi:hypothetical protein [Fluviicola sp.]|uniref:hypothetical protein n=1 Tax=Fluviicola sp. TaxID=1917219 RepID=UPI002616BC7A|nr:hypothetical protein [Fluviicola sp.]